MHCAIDFLFTYGKLQQQPQLRAQLQRLTHKLKRNPFNEVLLPQTHTAAGICLSLKPIRPEKYVYCGDHNGSK